MPSLSSKLLAWFSKSGRQLPWRNTRDPYKILVSEMMLQQTQVQRVLVFYERWLKQFPNWESLAKASNAEVIHAWAGLGYNRRALMLRDIARQIVAPSQTYKLPATTYNLPATRAEWQSLKGIGPYTSAALAAFSLHERVMPIDTNIRRALGRLLLGKPFPQPTDDERIQEKIDLILPFKGKFYDVPQALFDLASSVCTKVPDCTRCPLRKGCPAAKKFLSGNVRIPKKSVKKSVESRHRDKPHPDRIYRGRILKLVREEPGVHVKSVGKRVDSDFKKALDKHWIDDMIQRLEKDHLVVRQKGSLHLPD